jgi:succinoglycan biosynthesis protein ExoM
MMDDGPLPTIAIAICTYNRNEPLATLLQAIIVSAEFVAGKAKIGVVIVDDSVDGKARQVVERFEGQFELGLTYRFSGRQNISLARNLAIETASAMADWTAMIDDDCEPVPEWLEALLETQRRTKANAVTGPMVRRVPAGSPKWLVEQPFLKLGLEDIPDCSLVSSGSTFNSMISSQWIKDNPAIRFQPSLGVVGGEDMVFYRAAHTCGLRIYYSQRASVYENEPPTRATFAFQLRWYFWHGNSSYVASIRSGVPPHRLFLHGVNSLRLALLRPLVRVGRGQSPQLRYCIAEVLHAIGKMIGPLGIEIRHI